MSMDANSGRHRVYLVDGSRTPFLRAMNGPGPFSASDLALQACRPLLARQPFSPDQIDEVILGCVAPGVDEANIARIVALRLGCGDRVPAWTVQRNCASGLQALDSAARSIALGRADLILAGGAEAMSHYPVVLTHTMVRWLAGWSAARTIPRRIKQLAQLRPAHFQLVIALLKGLTDPVVGLTMGQTAEKISWRFGVTRKLMDEFAHQSHQRLAAAYENGRMDEVEPIISATGQLFEIDNGLRVDSTPEKLSVLKPAFDRPAGSITAGNSAQISDGAASLLLASETALEQHGLTPTAELVDVHWSALDPAEMGLGPVHAMSALLRTNGLCTEKIDYWEINEAFAGQVLSCLKAWSDKTYCHDVLGLNGVHDDIPRDRLNIDGGGISLGHPVGASGARIVLHLMNTLERTDKKLGIASLCIGGGQGGAALIRNVGENRS